MVAPVYKSTVIYDRFWRPEDSFFVPCPACDGEGQWEEAAPYHPHPNDPWPGVMVRCEYCDGTGSVETKAVPQLEMDEAFE